LETPGQLGLIHKGKTIDKSLSSHPWLRRLALAAALLLPFAAATLVYSRFLSQWFFRDDTAALTAGKNPDFLDFLRAAFSLPYWRPLVDFYFFAMYRLFGTDALPYHLVNVVLHGATATLTVLLIRRVTRSLSAGVLAGVLFAVAPAYGEAVVWISTAGPAMATLFSVTTIVLFLRYIEGEGGRGTLFLAVAAFFAALLSMEGSVCIPAVLVLLGLAVRPPSGAAESRRFIRALLPFVVLGVAYGVLQIVGSSVEPTPEHELSWHAAERLGDRVLWLCLPLGSPEYGSWVDGARWAIFALLTLAALAALLRRQWIMPALYASTVVALAPSSFVTGMFEYRWVYLASPLWAGFVAALAMGLVRWLWTRHVLAGGVALLVITSSLAGALLPHDTGVQRGMAGQAAQMEDIKEALEAGCPSLGPADTVFVLPIPIVDPPQQNLVLSLISLIRPGVSAVRVEATAFDPPSPRDCVLEWRSGHYQATPGANYVLNRFWSVSVSADCPQAVPWQRAALWADQLAIVRGPVVDVLHVGARSVLLIGEPGKFRVSTAQEHEKDLSSAETYLGRNICVRGIIRTVAGSSSIIIDDPRVIVIE
jgi:hypothetical protein